MANNYTSASFTIPVKDEDAARRWMQALEAWYRDETQHLEPAVFGAKAAMIESRLRREFEQGLGFQWEVEPVCGTSRLWIAHEESIDMETAIDVAMAILELDENDEVYTAEWANTCDKPRVDEFGGGAVAFSRARSAWMNTSTAAGALMTKLLSGHE